MAAPVCSSTQETSQESLTSPSFYELAAEDQRFCDATKAWFRIDLVPKMNRVLGAFTELSRELLSEAWRAGPSTVDGTRSKGNARDPDPLSAFSSRRGGKSPKLTPKPSPHRS